jgi:hypothetical protein
VNLVLKVCTFEFVMKRSLFFTVLYVDTKNSKNMANFTARLWSCGPRAS